MRFILLPILAAVAMLIGCGGSEPHPKAAHAPAIPVQTATVSIQQWPDVYEATGTVRARTAAVLSSKLMAYVRQVAVQVGDRVREGQLLVTLDSQDLDTNVRRAEAADAEVVSAIPEADNGVAGAKANLDLAQSTFKRMEELAAKKSISNQEFDSLGPRPLARPHARGLGGGTADQLDGPGRRTARPRCAVPGPARRPERHRLRPPAL